MKMEKDKNTGWAEGTLNGEVLPMVYIDEQVDFVPAKNNVIRVSKEDNYMMYEKYMACKAASAEEYVSMWQVAAKILNAFPSKESHKGINPDFYKKIVVVITDGEVLPNPRSSFGRMVKAKLDKMAGKG